MSRRRRRRSRPSCKRLDPNLPIEDLETLPEQVRNNTFLDRMMTTLSAAFALLATLLAAIGLYGVLAYTVAQRTREIGLRMALGAAPDRVRGMVLRQVAIMTLVGALVGLAGALGVGKGAQSILFQMTGADPTVLALSAVALALVALCAGFIPAHRASRVDPMSGVEIRIACGVASTSVPNRSVRRQRRFERASRRLQNKRVAEIVQCRRATIAGRSLDSDR